MKLRKLKIVNYKSLLEVEQENISNFHTFIGRNSLGKSSIFSAIDLLRRLHASLTNSHDLVSGSITDYEAKTIYIDLTFEIEDDKRVEYFTHYFGIEDDQIPEVLDTNVMKFVRILIQINVYGDKQTNRQDPNGILISHMEIYNSQKDPLPLIQKIAGGRQIRFMRIPNQAETHHMGSDIDHYLTTFSHNDKEAPFQIPGSFLQTRIISDILLSLKMIGSFREISKKVNVQTIENESQVDDRGHNLINLMDTLFTNETPRYLQVEEYCTRIFPDLESIRPKKLINNEVILQIKKKNLPYKIDLGDDGTGLDQLLIIIWRIATSNENTIWLLDEPELHLHPGAEKLLYDFLREEVKLGKQVIVTTHSMVFMYKSDFNEITLLLPNEGFAEFFSLSKLISAEQESSKIAAAEARDVIYRALGYDPTFSLEPKTVVMVEGKTDEKVLKAFAQILGKEINEKSVLFLPIGDKKRVEQFSPILTYALSGKNSIIILDNDNDKPEDVKKRVVKHSKKFQENSEISKDIITNENFCQYSEKAYSIEFYLLNGMAIAKAGNDISKSESVNEKIKEELAKPITEQLKPKEFLSNLWESMGFGPYGDTLTAEKIAQNIDKQDLSLYPEITEIINKITK